MNNIKYASQFFGRNVITFVYNSGAKRYAYLDDSYFKFTKTQLEFMQEAKSYIFRDYANYWFKDHPSWFFGEKG